MDSLFIFSIIFFIFSLITSKYKQKKRFRIVLDLLLMIVFTTVSIAYYISNYFTGKGINESVITTLTLGLDGAGYEEYFNLIFISFFTFLILFIMAFFYYRHLNKTVLPNPNKIKFFLHNSFLILAFTINPFFKDIYNMYNIYNTKQSDEFYRYYHTPALNKKDDFKQKNIVYIYAESLEKSYFNKNIFPNLTPKLSSLIEKNAIEFTNINQVYGTWFTIAGIVSSQCGIPLFTTSHGNSMQGIDKFYPKAVCLGDILKQDGYFLSFVQGARLNFGGKNKFFTTHQFDRLQGFDEYIDTLGDSSYQHGWGLYDDITVDNIYNEFIELSKKEDKFALFALTLDTHHPDGHLSKSCQDDLYGDGSNSILNTVKCSDELISNLIKQIQSSPYADNTLILLSSDHLAMRNTASEFLDTIDNRRGLFVVFDPSNKSYKEINKNGTMFDVASTLLGFVGIDTDLGFGRDLSIKNSIFDDFDDFDQAIPQFRDNILEFWSFPKLPKTLKLDFANNKIYIGKNLYSFPILIKVNQDNSIEPMFEFDGYIPLFTEFAHNMQENQKFIWIDRCERLNTIFEDSFKSEYCIAQGIYNKSLFIDTLKTDSFDIIRFDSIKSSNNSIYQNIISNAEKLINKEVVK